MKQKLHIKKGDLVKVIAGDNNGQQGKVLRVFPDSKTAIVEGVNLIKKHTKPNAKNTQGGIIEKESSIHISNLLPVDAKGNVSRVGRRLNDKNVLVRYSKKTGEEL